VEGLGAAQFAVPGAIDRLRATSHDDDGSARGQGALVLAATDPAQPWGAALDWPPTRAAQDGTTGHRPGRKAGALVVLTDGEPTIYVERGGKSLLSFTDDLETLTGAANALSAAVRDGSLNGLSVERTDGSGALDGVLAEALSEAGFRNSPKGLRLRA
jgi:ATP-dependent Lhr-like helicase